MTQKQSDQLFKALAEGCANYRDTSYLLNLEPQISALSTEQRYIMLYELYKIACEFDNADTLNVLVSNPIFNIEYNHDVIFDGLMTAIENNSILAIEYLLEEAPLAIKDSDEQDSQYLSMCWDALYFGFANPIDDNIECVEYLIDYIHSYTDEIHGGASHILEADQYEGFKIAWKSNNTEALKLLIDTYNLNGQEPELKKFLSKQKKKSLTDKDTIMTMIRSNYEKPMLEAMVGTATETGNATDNTTQGIPEGKVVENRRKNKI